MLGTPTTTKEAPDMAIYITFRNLEGFHIWTDDGLFQTDDEVAALAWLTDGLGVHEPTAGAALATAFGVTMVVLNATTSDR